MEIKQGTINQFLTLKADPSVSLHFPPVGLLRMFLQLLQATTVWAWLKITAVSLHPPHLTSMKQLLGVGTSLVSLCLFFSVSRVGCRRSLSICGDKLLIIIYQIKIYPPLLLPFLGTPQPPNLFLLLLSPSQTVIAFLFPKLLFHACSFLLDLVYQQKEVGQQMSVMRSERFVYFQNKAKHYHQLENIKSAVNSSPPKKRSPRPFRPRSLLAEHQIQQQNQKLIERLVSIEQVQPPRVAVEGTYSRYHRVDRPFRSLNPKREEQQKQVTIDNNQLKGRLEQARPAVGSQIQWSRDYSHSLSTRRNLSKFTESDKQKGDLIISTDRFLPQHLRDYALGENLDSSLSGKTATLSRKQLFALPKIEKRSRVEWSFEELEERKRQEPKK